MLICLLVLTLAFTFTAILAEANPPKPKPTKVIVEMHEDNDWDEDPPTVVAIPKKVVKTENNRSLLAAVYASTLTWWLNHRQPIEKFFSMFTMFLFAHITWAIATGLEG